MLLLNTGKTYAIMLFIYYAYAIYLLDIKS